MNTAPSVRGFKSKRARRRAIARRTTTRAMDAPDRDDATLACELLYCGATDFASVGRQKTNESGAHADLVEPHRYATLADKTWTRVAGGAGMAS